MSETVNCVQVTGPLSCIRCDYTANRDHDLGVSYEFQQQLFMHHLNTAHPDWQSETPNKNTIIKKPIDEAEHQRLRDAVVEATLAEWRDNPFLAATSSTKFMIAISELLQFEQEHSKS